MIASVLAHHDRQAKRAIEQPSPPPALAYTPETLGVLFGKQLS
jgi:hypothetical protein